MDRDKKLSYEEIIIIMLILTNCFLFFFITIQRDEYKIIYGKLEDVNNLRVDCEHKYNSLETLIQKSSEELTYSKDGLTIERIYTPSIQVIKNEN